MFFHHNGLKYYILEVEKLINIFKHHKYSDRQYKATATTVKKSKREKLMFFKKKILPEIKQHVENINEYIAKENHLLKTFHHTIIHKVMVEKMKTYQTLSKDEGEIHKAVGDLYDYHDKLYSIIKKLEKVIVPGNFSAVAESIERDLNELLNNLKQIYSLSIFIAKVFKEILKEIEETKKYLDMETRKIEDDFEENFKSWIYIAND